MEESKYLINNQIDTKELWKGIGGHFDSLNQIIHEIIDNSISNFKSNPQLSFHTILISIKKIDAKNVEIFIEDTGTGIKNINNAFTLGNKDSQESPLNEHGFGLKHALATANPNNDNWKVFTRTQELKDNNLVSVISSPFEINDYYGKHEEFNFENYPSKLLNYSTGTIVRFITSFEMYKSLGRNGIKDSKGIALYLKEDLGFIYSGIINSNIAEIQIVVDDEPKMIVNSVEPWWIENSYSREKVDLGLLAGDDETGEIILSSTIGTIKDRITIEENEKAVFYKTNMKNSGVEIRINGRMIKNNLLNEIWNDKYQHNRFNNFLVQINLESNKSSFLPSTRSSKNGFKQGDIKLLGLYNWIRTHCPLPLENKNDRDEIHLFEELKEIKHKQLKDIVDGKLTVEIGRRVLKRSKDNIRIDFFVAFNNKTIIYLGIKGVSSPIDLYKLKLYWDACVIDNLLPTNAILLANEHSELVQDLSSMNNSLKDINGNSYNFILKKWKDENINYPKT
jgi:hypothetical protein